MATYTYDQFQQAAQKAGLLNSFSAADLSLAQQNPDAGMSLLAYKQDYANATTDEARALANLGAEGIRSSYGSYTGGGDGSNYYLDPLGPSSFDYGSAPSWTGSSTSGDVADLWEQQKNYGSFSYDEEKPTYTNRYDETIQDLLNQVVNWENFSYDADTDPLYAQYRKAYAREGQRATADALAAAAAATGGLPSSYASAAASQAADYYAAQMTDKIPELQQIAYNQYLGDYNRKLTGLEAVQGAEQSDYAKYQVDLGQYNTDRNFAYTNWLDQYNMIANNLQTAQGMDQTDYNRYLDQLNQWNLDREFNYTQLLDEINSQTLARQEAMEKAQLAASYGDFAFLSDLGVNTDYAMADLAAGYGDYAQLQALGINPSSGSSSGGSGGGSSGGEAEELEQLIYEQLRNAGVSDEATAYAVLLQNGYGSSVAENLAKYYASWVESNGGAAGSGDAAGSDTGGDMDGIDTTSVMNLGLGSINYEQLEKLVEQGHVELYTTQTGKVGVRWAQGNGLRVNTMPGQLVTMN